MPKTKQQKQADLRALIKKRKQELADDESLGPDYPVYEADYHDDSPTQKKIEMYLADDDVAPVWAKYFKAPVEQFRQWRDWYLRGSNLCSGTTKAGQPCKKRVVEEAHHPLNFKKDYSDRCRLHARHHRPQNGPPFRAARRRQSPAFLDPSTSSRPETYRRNEAEIEKRPILASQRKRLEALGFGFLSSPDLKLSLR